MYREIDDQDAKDKDALLRYTYKEVLKFEKLTSKRKHMHKRNEHCDWNTILAAAHKDKADRTNQTYDQAYVVNPRYARMDDEDDDDAKDAAFNFDPMKSIFKNIHLVKFHPGMLLPDCI